MALLLKRCRAAYGSFGIAGAVIALARQIMKSKIALRFAFSTAMPVPRQAAPFGAQPRKKHKVALMARSQRKRHVEDIPGLIRELVLAMNQNLDMSERQQNFVEQYLVLALIGLSREGRHDRAAKLCKRVPTGLIKLDAILDGLDVDDALKIAAHSFRQDDWGTALRLLDWALSTGPRLSLEKRILTTATIIAEQVSHLDDTFEAKVITLRLSPPLTELLRNVAISSRHSGRPA